MVNDFEWHSSLKAEEKRESDIKLLREFVKALRGIEYPMMDSKWGRRMVLVVKLGIDEFASDLEREL